MNTIYKKIQTGLMALLLILGLSACVKNDFEIPDPMVIPVGEVVSIAELRQLIAANDNKPIKFTEDVSVFGVITMDGTTGNIYRGAFLQDATSAVNLRLMSPGGLFRGDSIHLNLKGTTLSFYEQMLQIDSVHTGNNVKKLATMVEVEPVITDILTLLTDPSYQARVVKLEGVEFHQNELGQTFADKENLITVNRMLRDCSGNQIIVRTSGYAGFADAPIPQGNGTFVGILAQFRNDRQLFIRSLDEVQLDGERCPTPGENMDPITIAEIRQLFASNITTIPANRRLDGVVISDRAHENHPGQNLFLMDENGDGIALRFASFHDFNLGDHLRILVGSLPIERFNGLLQVNFIPNGNGYVLGQLDVPSPTTTTLGALNDNFGSYESTLIRIENVIIPPTASFNGNIAISDGTGESILRTYAWASFANTPVTGGIYNVTAIASFFNGSQLLLRSLSDLEFIEEYDPGDADLITLAEIRSLFSSGATSVPAGKSIEVVVTSDKNNGNLTGRNAFVQDATAGITVRFAANHVFNQNDKVRIFVGGIPMSRFNGLLQISDVPNGNASLLQTNVAVEPQTTTIQNILANLESFESRLVRIENATITGGTTFQGTRNVNDGTGNINLFTRNEATFASQAVPSQAVTLTVNVSIFTTPQIIMRNLNDIE
ncbi:MAG: DUF5689 domain-containing protein [Bacteroidales bacterium]